MTSSLLTWVGLALLLFWTVGAYNRLVRLRAEVNLAFAEVDQQLQQQLQLAGELQLRSESGPDTAPAQQDPQQAVTALADEAPASWAGLQGASAQLAACLAVSRTRPLHAETTAALAAAWQVLATAWERAEREDAHDLSGPRLPEAVLANRAQLLAQALAATTRFNEAVARYNAAIAQFPAILLAWIFGFKRGRAL